MKKRQFIKLSGIVGAGVIVSPLMACNSGGKADPAAGNAVKEEADPKPGGSIPSFELPPLAYAFDALQPAIDAMTMEIHHDKHHAGYVKKLNAALDGNNKYGGMDLEGILANVTADEAGVRNNGGGHYNHSLYWDVLAPGGANMPEGQLLDAINSAFGSYDSFKEEFFNAAKTRFGSGWAWLNVDTNNKLFISSTPNQDNPMMKGIVKETGSPVLGIDVWEHAYYLNYQNKRGDYINAFMELINWNNVASRFASMM